jgi:hypothetical protein
LRLDIFYEACFKEIPVDIPTGFMPVGIIMFCSEILKMKDFYVRNFWVLTVVTIKITIFWDVTPCSLLVR